MTPRSARRWLILASFIICTGTFVFLLISPLFGYPLEWSQLPRVLELIIPVFLGYLGSAVHFLFSAQDGSDDSVVKDRDNLLGLMTKAPIFIFGLVMAAILVAFGWSNRAAAVSGTGMSVDQLSGAITIDLGILTVTTSVVVSHLFAMDKRMQASPPRAGEGRAAGGQGA